MAQTTLHRLESPPEPDVFIFGISCHERDYRLCWSLNKQLGLALTRCLASPPTGGERSLDAFAVFEHSDPETGNMIKLVCNRSSCGTLLPDHQRTDYFLIVDEGFPYSPDHWLEQVGQADFVLTIFQLDPTLIKNGYKLLE